MDNWY